MIDRAAAVMLAAASDINDELMVAMLALDCGDGDGIERALRHIQWKTSGMAQYATRMAIPYVDQFHLLEDPTTPDALAPQYDRGDFLHPNLAAGVLLASKCAQVAP